MPEMIETTPEGLREDLARLEAGGELVLADGVYDSVCLPGPLIARPEAPTIIRAATAGRAWVQPRTPYACGVYADNRHPQQWLCVIGLDVSGAAENGVNFTGGVGIRIEDCRVHDNAHNGIALHNNQDSQVLGCRIDHNGTDKAHGIYASGDRLVIADCVLWANAGYGVHLWETARNCQVSGNVCHGHGGAGIVVQSDHAARRARFANLIESNWTWGNRVGIQLSRGCWDRIVGNRAWGNREASISLHYPRVAAVFLDGNETDTPVVDPAEPNKE